VDRVDYISHVVQEIINYYNNDELELNPWYQRRSVWTDQQKAYLINTIFEKKPIPSIYIRHYLDIEQEKSIKEIVDGQQRIRAIIEYSDNEFSARHPGYNKKVKYSELKPSDKEAFKMTSLSIGSFIGSTDADVIEIFGRLNSVSKTLNAQEKRNAKYGGEFKQFSLEQAAQRTQIWRDLGVFTATEIARMTEVQFVSDLAINLLDGLTDYQAKKIDRYYKEYDERFAKRADLERRMERIFSFLTSLSPSAIKDTIFSRSPIFFSLFLVLDRMSSFPAVKRMEQKLSDMDRRYADTHAGEPRTRSDIEFYDACTASTQRIKSRKVRDKYISRLVKA
jgi:hypothetical protein